jgi:type II secretory pathway pseudopilin PulG
MMRRRSEVVIVIFALSVLAALIAPAIQQAREAARRSLCKNNVKQLCLALTGYSDIYQTFPYATIGNPNLTPEHRWSWHPQLTPLMAQMAPPPIDYSTDSRNSTHWPLTFTAKKHEVFTVNLRAPPGIVCPTGETDKGEHDQAYASYVGITGVGPNSAMAPTSDRSAGIWGYDRCTLLSEITGGLSQTILVMETASDRDVWLFGGRPTARWVSTSAPQIGPGKTFGGCHFGIAFTGLADGSVVALSTDTDAKVLARMATIHDDIASTD